MPLFIPQGWVLQATTGLAGFALQNATPTFLNWNVPNDGQLHRALIVGTINVTLAETGGTLQQAYTDPAANAIFSQIDAGGHAAGAFQFTAKLVSVQAGTPVGIRQSVALSAGAATVWAEIWGS